MYLKKIKTNESTLNLGKSVNDGAGNSFSIPSVDDEAIISNLTVNEI